MKCSSCYQEILQKNPQKCPYCGGTNLVPESSLVSDNVPSRPEEVEQLESAGQFEDAAIAYEELQMRDKAEECRKMAKTTRVATGNLDVGKVSAISMECPYCCSIQLLASRANKLRCKRCGKDYIIPKKVLDAL